MSKALSQYVDQATNALKVDVVSGGSSTAQGTYNATPPTLSDGATSSNQLDVNGNLKTTLATLLYGEDAINNMIVTEHRYVALANITTNTTTTLNGQRFLHSLVINTKGALANQVILKDGTTVVHTFDTTDRVGTILLDEVFATSLVAVTQTGTAADITLIGR